MRKRRTYQNIPVYTYQLGINRWKVRCYGVDICGTFTTSKAARKHGEWYNNTQRRQE